MFVLQLFQGSLITTIYGGRCKITTKTRVGIKASLEPPRARTEGTGEHSALQRNKEVHHLLIITPAGFALQDSSRSRNSIVLRRVSLQTRTQTLPDPTPSYGIKRKKLITR